MARYAICIATVLCILISSFASNAKEYYLTAVENEDLIFILVPGDTVVVTFEPWKTGYWTVHTWHDGLSALLKTSVIDYYYTDLANPNDEYHYWESDPFNFSWWFRSTETLWSGHESIGYQFVVKQVSQEELPSTVFIYIQRWE